MIPYGRQQISQEDIDAVVQVLQSDWLTQGPCIEKFERAVADYCGASYAVATCNATAALHLGCLALGVDDQSIGWTSPNTFVASANCLRYCEAEVDFVDIDARTWNLSVEALDLKLEQACKNGCLPKVIIPVHFSGQPCEMERIRELSNRYGISIMEDAAHAIGATYNGARVGSCKYSELTVFSFHPVKIITTGEGGILLTNRRDLYEKLLLLRSHGITRQLDQMTQPAHGGWYYQQVELGYNYRITDIQAALGISQLERIEQFVERRNQLALRYEQLLRDLPLTLPYTQINGRSSWHLYVVRLQLQHVRLSHREVFEQLRASNIGVHLHYIPVHTQPYYAAQGFKLGDFPEAESYYSEAITLPMFPTMTDAQQDYVVSVLQDILQR
ncbi:MAG TPA: UDP-4-amino-4,6-dideoxy-N-acetyl-beta-L-altrosamine transaminase [Methylophilaceae bacterium]|nr:UDP-4-amino-4,6-dideoxy-N-acetyl-beta-L-altrosamine transaminase [Methylophilaceae bacterium]